MSEPEVRIGKNTGVEYTVISTFTNSEGTKYVWVSSSESEWPSTWVRHRWESATSPKPTFFEVGKEYVNKDGGSIRFTVHELVEVLDKRYAAVTYFHNTNRAFLVNQDSFKDYRVNL